jgi:hypothetical protein
MFNNNKLNEEQLNQIEEKKKGQLDIPLNNKNFDFCKNNIFSDKVKNSFDLDFLKPNCLNGFNIFNGFSNKINFNFFNQNENNNINDLKSQNDSFIFPFNNYNIKKDISINQDENFLINSDIINNNKEAITSLIKDNDILNIIKNDKGKNIILNNRQINVNKNNNDLFNLNWPKYNTNINFNNNQKLLFSPIKQFPLFFQNNNNNFIIEPINNNLNDKINIINYNNNDLPKKNNNNSNNLIKKDL